MQALASYAIYIRKGEGGCTPVHVHFSRCSSMMTLCDHLVVHVHTQCYVRSYQVSENGWNTCKQRGLKITSPFRPLVVKLS